MGFSEARIFVAKASIAEPSVSLISPSLSLSTPIYDHLGRVVAPGQFLPFLFIPIRGAS
jgi:hypothetical protein